MPWHAPHEPKDKRRNLVQHSLLKLNTTVVHDYPEHFDEHSVDERGARLTDLITQLWPGPQGGSQVIAKVETIASDGDAATAIETDGEDYSSDEPSAAMSRDAIREQLEQGLTVGQICEAAADKRAAYLMAIEAEARLAGRLNNSQPNAENAASLRDERHLRWERIAARLYGDARRVDDANACMTRPGAQVRPSVPTRAGDGTSRA